MKTSFEKNANALTAKPEGRLDTATSPEFGRQVQKELNGVMDITIDLKEVEYISSGGLRVLLSLEQEMEDRNGKMSIVHANSNILEVFELTGFLDIFHVE